MTGTLLAQRPSHLSVVGSDRVTVQVFAADPITQFGLCAQLSAETGLRAVATDDDAATVALAVADTIDDDTLAWLATLRDERAMAVVLVVSTVEPHALANVIDAGVSSIVQRSEATPDRLAAVLRGAARGQSELPPTLLRSLLDQVERLGREVLAPRGLSITGVSRRERDVLRLIADGFSTREVANQLCYSERTIKNVLQELTTRLHLRNRTQAVAYALRNGWI